MTETPQRPTAGQQRILQLLTKVSHVLIGERVSGVPHYRIEERGTRRIVVEHVSVVMVTQLIQRGWIAPIPIHTTPAGEMRTWRYKVTEAGVWAANAPLKPESE